MSGCERVIYRGVHIYQLSMATSSVPESISSPEKSSIAKTVPMPSPSYVAATGFVVPASGVPVRVTESPTDWLATSIQIAVAIFAAAASTGAILWQIRQQRVQAQQQHRQSVKAELQLDAYRDFQRAFGPLAHGWVPTSAIAILRVHIQGAISQAQVEGFHGPVLSRTDQFMKQVNAYCDNVIALVFFLERYEALLPGFDIFKSAFGKALNDVNQLRVPVQSALMSWLPLEHPDFGKVTGSPQFIYCPVITPEAEAEIEKVLAPLDVALGQLNCWSIDLSNEVQNALLGEYADQRVQPRNPTDQTYFVIATDPKQRDHLLGLLKDIPHSYGTATAGRDALARARTESMTKHQN